MPQQYIEYQKIKQQRSSQSQDKPRPKFICNRASLWEGFNQKWPPYGKQFTFQVAVQYQTQSPQIVQPRKKTTIIDLMRKIEDKQKLLQEIYMPRSEIRTKTLPQTPPVLHKTPRQSRTLDSPQKEPKTTARSQSAVVQMRKRKKHLRLQELPMGLNVSKCNFSDRVRKMKINIDYSRPATEHRSICNKQQRATTIIQSPDYKPKMSIPLSKWEYSDVSFDLF